MGKGKEFEQGKNIEESDARSSRNKPGGISRRGFLSLSVLAGCAAIGAPIEAGAKSEFKGWPKSFGMLTDFTECVGCRSCERACNEANGLPSPDRPFDDASVFKEARWPSSRAYCLPCPLGMVAPISAELLCSATFR